MGLLARQEGVRKQAPEFKGLAPLKIDLVHPGAAPFEAARIQAASFFVAATHVPEVCLVGAYNDYQAKQCQDFWRRLAISGLVAIVPLIVALLFLWLVWDDLSLVYRRARKRVAKGEALLTATVTRPARARETFFSFSHCLRSVRVQGNDGKQLTVYMSLETPLPAPGTSVAVFDGGKFGGAARHFAIVYAPHVVVLRGSN